MLPPPNQNASELTAEFVEIPVKMSDNRVNVRAARSLTFG